MFSSFKSQFTVQDQQLGLFMQTVHLPCTVDQACCRTLPCALIHPILTPTLRGNYRYTQLSSEKLKYEILITPPRHTQLGAGEDGGILFELCTLGL